MPFSLGDRVRISNEHWKARGALGTVAMPPEIAREVTADNDPWEGYRRFVQFPTCLFELYWIEFDSPQLDEDGDGPFNAGEIPVDALELVQDDTDC